MTKPHAALSRRTVVAGGLGAGFLLTRSSLLLAALLTAEGYTPDDAFKRLTKARGLQVPDTRDQIRWVERFAARQAP